MSAESSPVKISVVVASFNRAHYLPGALESLTRQETDDRFQYEVFVVDNASTDNTAAVVREFAATSAVPVHYLHEAKPGDAPPRNHGIRQSDGDWIAFFDDDQFAEPHWLRNLLRVAIERETLIVGGPVCLDLEDAVCGQLSAACRSTLREMKPYAHDQPYEPHVIPGTGNMLVARAVFDRVGLFAEDIKEGGSDWKLVNDARGHSIEPWYAAQATIRHRVEGNRLSPAYFRWDAQNGGVSQADFDLRRSGLRGLLLRCAARLGRGLAFLPGHLWSLLRQPAHGSSQASMVWWRTAGYLRRAVTITAPNLCPQRRFHSYVDFRNGRTIGTESQPCPPL